MSESVAPAGQAGGPRLLRLFLALTPPEAIQGALAEVQARLRARLPARAVKWTPPEQIHLTLRFLGGVAEDAVNGLAEAVARVAAAQTGFALHAQGLGVFPTVRRPRVIWVGVGGGLRELDRLQAAVLAATTPWGGREEKAFHAHLTLGRIRELPPARLRTISDALSGVEAGRLGGWTVAAVELYRSELFPEGAVHTRLGSFTVGNSVGAAATDAVPDAAE